jgi:DNA-directed RNA polymerase subunit H (RpoH/RPB5)
MDREYRLNLLSRPWQVLRAMFIKRKIIQADDSWSLDGLLDRLNELDDKDDEEEAMILKCPRRGRFLLYLFNHAPHNCNESIGVDTIKYLLANLNNKNTSKNHFMFVTKSNLTPNSRAVLLKRSQVDPDFTWEHFLYKELQFDLTTHRLVPYFELVTHRQEQADIVKKYCASYHDSCKRNQNVPCCSSGDDCNALPKHEEDEDENENENKKRKCMEDDEGGKGKDEKKEPCGLFHCTLHLQNCLINRPMARYLNLQVNDILKIKRISSGAAGFTWVYRCCIEPDVFITTSKKNAKKKKK